MPDLARDSSLVTSALVSFCAAHRWKKNAQGFPVTPANELWSEWERRRAARSAVAWCMSLAQPRQVVCKPRKSMNPARAAVREGGLEPPRNCFHKHLKLACLPDSTTPAPSRRCNSYHPSRILSTLADIREECFIPNSPCRMQVIRDGLVQRPRLVHPLDVERLSSIIRYGREPVEKGGGP